MGLRRLGFAFTAGAALIHLVACVSRGMAADPNHPLAGITSVLANPQLSQMRPDGALYLLTDEARGRLLKIVPRR